jgi:hypothetical protein
MIEKNIKKIELLHTSISKEAQGLLNGQKGILVEITFVHCKYAFQITLFNFI